jgi:hypothetical protein
MKRIAKYSLIAVVVASLLVGNMLTMFAFAAMIGWLLYLVAQYLAVALKRPESAGINGSIVICAGLFAFGLFYFAPLVFNGYVFRSDTLGELTIYQGVLHNGIGYQGEIIGRAAHDSLLHTAIITTRLPALIQPFTGLEPVAWYRLYLAILLSLAPACLFLLCKKAGASTLVSLAIIALFMGQFYFVDGFSFTRIVTGTAVYFLIAWLLLKWKNSWRHVMALAGLCTLMAFTYYGVSAVAIICVAATIPFILFIQRDYLLRVSAMLAIFVIIATAGYSVARQSDNMLGRGFESPVKVIRTLVRIAFAEVKGETMQLNGRTTNISDWGSRENVVQVAFGKDLSGSSLGYKVNWALQWVMILGVSTLSLVGFWHYKDWLSSLGLVHFLLCVLAVAIPSMGIAWGIARFWFVGAPLMMIGGARLINEKV